MTRHFAETELALYASGDLALWRRASVRMHIGRCERCRETAAAYQKRRTELRAMANEVPEGLDWDRLAGEMTANIRVGLAAGECVAPRARKRIAANGWRSMALASGVAAGMVLLVAGGFWLNFPASDTTRLMQSFAHRPAERGMVLEATSAGVELQQNGSSLGMSQGNSARPESVSLNLQGSASARYVSDSGQVTITSVHVE
jgi:hypothetical protein